MIYRVQIWTAIGKLKRKRALYHNLCPTIIYSISHSVKEKVRFGIFLKTQKRFCFLFKYSLRKYANMAGVIKTTLFLLLLWFRKACPKIDVAINLHWRFPNSNFLCLTTWLITDGYSWLAGEEDWVMHKILACIYLAFFFGVVMGSLKGTLSSPYMLACIHLVLHF